MSRRRTSSRSTRTRKASTPRRDAGEATASPRRSSRARPARQPAAPAPPPPPPDDAAPLETSAPAVEVLAAEATTALATPEPGFAARVPAPEPPRPLPSRRRAIFFDIENSSRPEHVARVVDYLAVDRLGRRTDFIAVGNWRVVAPDTARLLAQRGAQLVHSAPAAGVRDWSDLRIAISAGVWLAGAAPGDVIEVVSDDRAFDAVGDVASSLGIAFRRLSYRSLAGATIEEAPTEEAEPGQAGRRRWRGRRGRRPVPPGSPPSPAQGPPRPRQPAKAAVLAPPRPAPPAPAGAPPVAEEPHTAPHDAVLEVVRELLRKAGGQPISLDAVANALKTQGFSRTPGSPRLVTRLRRFKELEVSRSGQVSLVEGAVPAPGTAPVSAAPLEAVPVSSVQVAPLEAVPVLTEAAAATTGAEARGGPGAGEDRTAETAEGGAAGEPDQPRSRRRRPRRRGGRRRLASATAPPQG